jgi:hypothetical protein
MPYDLMWPASKRLSKNQNPEANGKVVEEPEKLLAMKRAGRRHPTIRA